jgi:hypothetical protein
VTDYEYGTAWLVIAKELQGRVEVCDMRTTRVSTSDQLTLQDNSLTTP